MSPIARSFVIPLLLLLHLLIITTTQAKLLKTIIFITVPTSPQPLPNASPPLASGGAASTLTLPPDFDFWFRLGTRLRDVYIRSHRLVSSKYDPSHAFFGTVDGRRRRNKRSQGELIRLAEALGMGIYQEEFSSTKLGIVPGDLVTVKSDMHRNFGCDEEEEEETPSDARSRMTKKTREAITKARLLHEITHLDEGGCALCVYLVSRDDDDDAPLSRLLLKLGEHEDTDSSSESPPNNNVPIATITTPLHVFSLELHERIHDGERYLKIHRDFTQVVPRVNSNNYQSNGDDDEEDGLRAPLLNCPQEYCSLASISAASSHRAMSVEDLKRVCALHSETSSSVSDDSYSSSLSSTATTGGGGLNGTGGKEQQDNEKEQMDVLVFSDDDHSGNDREKKKKEDDSVGGGGHASATTRLPTDDDFRKGFIFGVGISLCMVACFMGGGGSLSANRHHHHLASSMRETRFGGLNEGGEEEGRFAQRQQQQQQQRGWRVNSLEEEEEEEEVRFLGQPSDDATNSSRGRDVEDPLTKRDEVSAMPAMMAQPPIQHTHIPRPKRGGGGGSSSPRVVGSSVE